MFEKAIEELNNKQVNKSIIAFEGIINQTGFAVNHSSKDLEDLVYLIKKDTIYNRFIDIIDVTIKKYPTNLEYKKLKFKFAIFFNDYNTANHLGIELLNIQKGHGEIEEMFFNFNLYYINELIKNDKIHEAKSLSLNLKNFYDKNTIALSLDIGFCNLAENLNFRVLDHELIKDKIKDLKNESKKNQLKIIEILGFFIAIVSFIFVNVEVFKNISNYDLAIKYLISFSLILLCFLSTLFLMFNSENKFLRVKNLLALIFILALLLIFYFYNANFLKYKNINKEINNNKSLKLVELKNK